MVSPVCGVQFGQALVYKVGKKETGLADTLVGYLRGHGIDAEAPTPRDRHVIYNNDLVNGPAQVVFTDATAQQYRTLTALGNFHSSRCEPKGERVVEQQKKALAQRGLILDLTK